MSVKELYFKLTAPNGLTLPACPLCGSHMELWEYRENDDYARKAVHCSNNGGEDGEECPLYMPGNAFYKATKREAIAVFNRLFENSKLDQLQAENAKLKAELEELKILHADSTNLALSQMYAGARKEIEELKAEVARLSEPDMFWDYHSAETDYESADELASECADEHLSLGESMTITVQLAKKLPNRQMRVTAPLSCDGECAWEWIKPNGEQQ